MNHATTPPPPVYPVRPPGRIPPQRNKRPRRRWIRRLALALCITTLLAAGIGTALYLRLDTNIHSLDLKGALGSDRPAPGTGENILLLGSDTRAGDNARYAGGKEQTGRSDVAMVLHLAPDRRSAQLVSIPRDTLIDRPQCTTADGATVPAARGVMFNTAFAVGGPLCSVKTAESVSGLRIDHVISIDFAGFARAVDALGGVDITVSRPIKDTYSGLDIPAGTSHLNGKQALAFTRTRHGVGDGSDLGRITLEQQMIAAILTKAKTTGLLTSPVRLFRMADALTSSITTDSALASVKDLVDFGKDLKALDQRNVTMVTLPVRPAPTDHNRVVPRQPQARALWHALKSGQPIPASVKAVQRPDPATEKTR
ncbi:LCP family protein [Streptoverticillium reticulum]|uniref:LCP family protein n=1 Tax=Streptoverticillium reticulum TaxID=1433415 RepID=UPI0039BF5570